MEWISVIIGAGGLVGIVTAFLTYRTSQKEREIQWYDRAIKEIDRLEDKLDETTEKAKFYRRKYWQEKRKNNGGDDDDV